MEKLLTFAGVNRLLSDHNMVVDAAEIHGMMCGMLCGGMALSNQSWREAIADTTNQGEALAGPVDNIVVAVFNQTCQQLVEGDYGLTLLLPDDSTPINDRGLALIHWVQGYMLGFGLFQNDLTKCSEEVKEALEDFADIARMEEPMNDDEESEKALHEVVEYVRISALLCFSELGQSLLEDQQDNPSVH